MNLFRKEGGDQTQTPITFDANSFQQLIETEQDKQRISKESVKLIYALQTYPEVFGEHDVHKFIQFAKDNNLSEYDLEQWAYRLLLVTKNGYSTRPRYSEILTGQHTQQTLGYAEQLFQWARIHGCLKQLGQTFIRDNWKNYTYSQRISGVDFGTGLITADNSRLRKINEHGRLTTYYSCDYCGRLQPVEMAGEGKKAIFSEPCLTCGAKFDFTELKKKDKDKGEEALSLKEKQIRQNETFTTEQIDPITGKKTTVEIKKDIKLVIKEAVENIMLNTRGNKYDNLGSIIRDFNHLSQLLCYTMLDYALLYYRVMDYIDKNGVDYRGNSYKSIGKKMDRPKSVSSIMTMNTTSFWNDLLPRISSNYNSNNYPNKNSAIAALLLDVIVPKDGKQFNRMSNPPVLKFDPRIDFDSNEATVRACFCYDCGNAFKINLTDSNFVPVGDKKESYTAGKKYVFEIVKSPCSACSSKNTGPQYVQKHEKITATQTELKNNKNLLLTILAKHFTIQEFKELCSKVRVPYEDLAGKESKTDTKSLELIQYCQRRGLFDNLVSEVLKFEPNSAMGGELINVKCMACQRITTKQLNQQEQIEGPCEMCQNESGYNIAKAR